MGALDRLDLLEEFLLELRPDEVFGRTASGGRRVAGTARVLLPETIAKRVGDLTALAAELRDADRELVVFASDVTETERPTEHNFELSYSARDTPPEVMAQASSRRRRSRRSCCRFASATGSRPTGVTRNFPLGYAPTGPRWS